MATRIPALIQLSDPRVAAQLVNTTRADVGSKTHFKHLYISYPICCEHFENSQYVDPAHRSLVPQTFPTIFSSGIPIPAQMIAGLRPRRCSWRMCAAIACHNTTHNSDVCFFHFPNEDDGDRYVLIVSSMKVMYHKCWRTYVLSQILSVTHPPAVALRSRWRPLTSVSFNYVPSLPPFMLPFRILFDMCI